MCKAELGEVSPRVRWADSYCFKFQGISNRSFFLLLRKQRVITCREYPPKKSQELLMSCLSLQALWALVYAVTPKTVCFPVDCKVQSGKSLPIPYFSSALSILSLIYSPLHSSNKYLLCLCYVPGTVLDAGMQQWMEANKNPALREPLQLTYNLWLIYHYIWVNR